VRKNKVKKTSHENMSTNKLREEVQNVSLNEQGKIKNGEARRLASKYKLKLNVVNSELNDYSALKQVSLNKEGKEEQITCTVLVLGSSGLHALVLLSALTAAIPVPPRVNTSSTVNVGRMRETRKDLLEKRKQQRYMNRKK
jgi:hypothetical protein